MESLVDIIMPDLRSTIDATTATHDNDSLQTSLASSMGDYGNETRNSAHVPVRSFGDNSYGCQDPGSGIDIVMEESDGNTNIHEQSLANLLNVDFF